MKKILFSTMLLGGLFAASAQTASADVSTLEYGKIKKGEDGTRYFTITNKGDKPLQIIKATAGCGCTTPQAPTEPIAPGASAKVKVGYDTNRVGNFNKNVDLETNDPVNPKLTLFISGEVLPDPTAEAPSFNPATLPSSPAVSAATQQAQEKVTKVKDKVNNTKNKVKDKVLEVKDAGTNATNKLKGQTLPPPPVAPKVDAHAGHGH
jgi:Protein of unknown function (DUF1573)